MKIKIYTVHDSKAKLFNKPFTSQNNATATRAFAYACNDPEHEFCRFPQDFTLFEVGEFNTDTGAVKRMVANSLGLAASFVNPDFPETAAAAVERLHAIGGKVQGGE